MQTNKTKGLKKSCTGKIKLTAFVLFRATFPFWRGLSNAAICITFHGSHAGFNCTYDVTFHAIAMLARVFTIDRSPVVIVGAILVACCSMRSLRCGAGRQPCYIEKSTRNGNAIFCQLENHASYLRIGDQLIVSLTTHVFHWATNSILVDRVTSINFQSALLHHTYCAIPDAIA